MSDFPVKQPDRVNGLAIVIIGLASSALLWASVIALQAYYEVTEGEIAAQRATMGRADGVRGLKAKQTESLNMTVYADPNKGTLKRLAIAHAKKAVLRDAKAGNKSLIPTLGELNTATIPASAGKPAIVPVPAPGAAPAVPLCSWHSGSSPPPLSVAVHSASIAAPIAINHAGLPTCVGKPESSATPKRS